MLRTRECPRCGGDLILEGDPYGAYSTCLQCGYLAYNPTPAPRPSQGESIAPKRGRLVVKGEAMVMGEESEACRALATQLKTLGVPATAAPQEDAWQLLESQRYSLVFIDARGAHISALATAKRIKRLWPSTRLVMVVDWDSDDEGVLLNTVDRLVHKPLTRAELATAVEVAPGQALRPAMVA